MARRRFLRNAPIREAIIDVRITPTIDPSKLATLAEGLKQTFPKQDTLRQGTFGFEIASGELKPSTIESGVRGRLLASEDGKYVLQMRSDGFTFSRLPPYETWERMRQNAKPLWDTYVAAAGASTVSRIAVRYINVMPLPLPIGDFDEYLTAPPQVPAALPQELAGFFSRVIIVSRNIDALAVVTQALEPQAEQKVPVILDIDVYREVPAAEWSASDPRIWDTLDQLREFKNQVFFECITEKTAELFE